MRSLIPILVVIVFVLWTLGKNAQFDEEVAQLTLEDSSEVFNKESPETSVVALAQLYDLGPLVAEAPDSGLDLGTSSDYCRDVETAETALDLRKLSELSLSLYTNRDLNSDEVKEVRGRIVALKETYEIPRERHDKWPMEKIALAEVERLSDEKMEQMDESEYKLRLASYGGSPWLEQYYLDVVLRNGILEKWDPETIHRINSEKELIESLSDVDNSAGLPGLE